MPRFGGFNTSSFTGALINNALGTVANAVFPNTVFGGFGASALGSIVGQQGLSQNADNRRASLKPKPAAVGRVLGNGLLNPLKETGGLIWPYTPSIQYTVDPQYETISTVHANQDMHVFNRRPAVTLVVDGDFTVQNQKEGQYALAVLHFLRTMSMMHFGESDPLAGTPPPILLFNAYGKFVFNNVPVILKSFNMSFGKDVDYVQVRALGSTGISDSNSFINKTFNTTTLSGNNNENTQPGSLSKSSTALPNAVGTNILGTTAAGGSNYVVWLPSQFTINTTLIVQHTPKELRSRFNLPAYRDGRSNQSDFI